MSNSDNNTGILAADRRESGAPILRVLLVEDDAAMRSLLVAILEGEGYRITMAEDGLQAIGLLQEGKTYDIVLTDLKLPGADGVAVLRKAREALPKAPVLLLTAHGSISSAVEAMKVGAFDYLTKPLPSPETLRVAMGRAAAEVRSQEGVRAGGQPQHEAGGKPANVAMKGLIWADPASIKVLEMLRVVAGRDTTVLLLGESGVGKDVAAGLIHTFSDRCPAPLVSVNCAAVPDSLFESEFFGHEKGAFTGAVTSHKGHLEEAHGGTIFLDEVGELSVAHQAKLLRAIEERQVVRVGGQKKRPADARVVAATNRELFTDVQRGRFRQDLYYRLSVLPITIPPLRDRKEDILPLARQFLLSFGGQPRVDRDGAPGSTLGAPLSVNNEPAVGMEGFSAAAELALLQYPWPGNVRELRNVIERAVILSGEGDVLEAESLFPPGGSLQGLAGVASKGAAGRSDGATLRDLERDAILEALEECGGNRKEVARRLGISLRNLQYKLKDYGVVKTQ